MLFWVVIGFSSVGKLCRTPPLISPPAPLALVIDLHLLLISVVIQTQTQVLWMSMLNPVRLRPRKHRHVLVYAMNLWFAAAHLRLVHDCPLY
ncbi:hypothetical protein DFH08DRAFT_973762 [Mycena albidolilacea]|uniref:Uncharacterized protein n=1 Tax=Mycena albidolilacea TaxID=1033008 RepID=A0AAD6Z7X8_9AGAR|nr:hypothetical protein DFH08DRAFT_973762 [Mycena albidolilacea]